MDAPTTPDEQALIGKFERLLTHYRTELELNAEERHRQRRDVVERDVIAHTLDLVIYALNSMTEVYALLLAKLTYPDARVVWDRHLVIHLHAVLEAFPKLARNVLNETDRLAKSGNTHIDADALREAYARYGRAVRPVNAKEFRTELSRIRNSVIAHHLTSKSNIDGLVEWVNTHAPSAQRSTLWIDDPVIINTLKWSEEATTFGHTAYRLLNVHGLPPIPTDPADYKRRTAALDEPHEV